MTYNLKSAKIGGTINFGSAGSFSFSFGAEIGSPEDYLRLVEQGASSLLGQFRDADEETKSAVRAYIARLCSIPEDRVPVVQPAQKSAPVEEPEPAPVRAPEPTPIAPPVAAPAPVMGPAPTAAEQAAAAVAQCIKPPTTVPKEPAPSAPPEGFSLCAECGEAVPANQAKLSQLFMNKTLCKSCLDGRRS